MDKIGIIVAFLGGVLLNYSRNKFFKATNKGELHLAFYLGVLSALVIIVGLIIFKNA